MKKLRLQNDGYRLLLSNYKEWLDILGYAESTIYYLPNHLQEFFYYLERQGISTLNEIHNETIKEYYTELQQRANERTSGGLSSAYLNKHQQALKKFKEYLKNHNYNHFNIHLKWEQYSNNKPIDILTQNEIKELFLATTYSHEKESFMLRDRALLTILYSCGLRRNEAVHLDVGDIYFDKDRIYVRKGKNYKERFVPINDYNLRILEDYLFEARLEFYKSSESEAFFVSSHGKRMSGQSMLNRLKHLIEITGNKTLQEKHITLHTLRHSIATHLLESEVKMESISKFLGHSSLESTQIYTHLVKQL